MPPIRKMTRVAFMAGALALLVACGGQQAVRPELEAQARELLAQGRYQEAANEYLRLAQQSRPPASEEFVIKAAAALMDGGDIAAARGILDHWLGGEASVPARTARDVLMARIALAEHDPARALELLPPGMESETGNVLQRLVRESRVEALEALGRYLEAARERVALDPLLTDVDAIAGNHAGTWQAVSRLSPLELQQAGATATGELAGWLELAALSGRSLAAPDALARELQDWRLRFPGHPAEAAIVPELERVAQMGATRPAQVALLLPLSGTFGNAGQVVRDGFMAAWLEESGAAERPTLTFHDSDGADVVALYRQAVAAGAEFVVGPLQKEQVAALAGEPDRPVPVLALNYAEAQVTNATPAAPAQALPPPQPAPAPGALPSPDPTLALAADDPAAGPVAQGPGADGALLVRAPLYQFALSPEGEAENAAERAWFDGASRAALITPDSSLGARIAGAFARRWEELGGLLVAREVYENDARDLSDPIERLLNMDRSEERLRRLREVIGRGVKHEPRPRGDVDMVMMMGSPTQGRLLKPQLLFHRAGGLPVYATSHVYAAAPNPGQDLDLNGIRFGDMPWVLPGTGRDDRLRREVSNAFPGTPPTLRRLHAFGVDAYRLVPQLGRLRAQPYATIPAATGDLSVDEDNRVRRKLVWAQFVDGQPAPLDPAGGMLP